MENYSQPRKTVRLKTPNPLFEKWLLEWHLEAVSVNNPVTIYSQALESLRKFPLVLKSGLECFILEHFDNNLCFKLNKKLEEHRNQNGIQSVQSDCPDYIRNQKQDIQDLSNPSKTTQKKLHQVLAVSSSPKKTSPTKKKTKAYKPAKRSAAYGLLIALFLKEREIGSAGFMTKAELMAKAQAHCDVSLRKSAPGTYYSGWSSMSQLVSKSLVERSGNPAKFSLTEAGRALAQQLQNNDLDSQSASSHVPVVHEDPPVLCLASPSKLIMHPKRGKKKKEAIEESESGGASSQSQEFETEEMIFLPSSFDIILLVDTAETAGSAKRDEDEAIIGLTNTGIKFEVRHLKVGDYVWICRDPLGREMVLPYIVERKRLDDLGSSIKDGRFHEQKFRLKQCGLPNRIYLVEDSGQDRNGLPLENIHQAITNTLACDKFSIKVTRNLQESMRYLAKVTEILTEKFQAKTLLSCKKEDLPTETDLNDDIISLLSFNDFSFNMGKMKAFTPREIFAKQLIQMHGLSADKAWVISEHYGSPKELIEGFLSGDAEAVISQLTCGLLERKVGSQIASTLKLFYTTHQFTG